MNHTNLLNYLISKYDLESYCEIGVRTTEQNFDKIKCKLKYGIDPCFKYDNYGIEQPLGFEKQLLAMTSDDFFKVNSNTFSLVFIDGNHTADQVQRDFENSLKCLNEGGFIVIHDTCPDEEECTKVPRTTKKWFGNVFSFAMNLGRYNGINFLTLGEDCGMTIVWKLREVTIPKEIYSFDWEDYINNRRILLQVGTLEQFNKLMVNSESRNRIYRDKV